MFGQAAVVIARAVRPVAIRALCRHFYPAAQSQVRARESSASRKMTACRETDCHVASLLAMTEEIGARAQTINHICHCEAPKGPWQSQGTDGREISGERYFPEIATSLRSSQ